MDRTPWRSMARSRSSLAGGVTVAVLSPLLVLTACGVLAATPSTGGKAAASAAEKAGASRFVATLLNSSAAPISSSPQDCLSSKDLASKDKVPVTVGRELAAIFARYIDAGWSFSVTASCEAGEGPTRQFCTLSFAHKDSKAEASAGFTFLGNPVDGQLDPQTLECFQTP